MEGLSIEQRLTELETKVERILQTLAGQGGIPTKLVAASPVAPGVYAYFGAGWFDATGFAVKYGTLGHYHTGADLNLPGYQDSGKPVYATADGYLKFIGKMVGWEAQLVVIEHDDGGRKVWTRYAHIVPDANLSHEAYVKRGDRLGVIADYNHDGPKGDHLHFDVALTDLGAQPGDWPGVDLARLKATYLDPLQWLVDHQPPTG